MSTELSKREKLIEEINLIYEEGKEDEIEDCKDSCIDDNDKFVVSDSNNNSNSFYDYNKSCSIDYEDVLMLSIAENISKSTLEDEELKRVIKESQMEAVAINRSLVDGNNKNMVFSKRINKSKSFYDLRKRNNAMAPKGKELEHDVAMKEAIQKSLLEVNNKFENVASIKSSKNPHHVNRVDSGTLFDLAVEEALKRSLEEVANTMSVENIRNVNSYFKSNKSFDLDLEFALRKSIEEAANYNVNIGIDSNYFDKVSLSEKTGERSQYLYRSKGSFDADVEEALKITLIEAVQGLSEEKLVAANNYLRHKKSFDYRLEESLRKSLLSASINKMNSVEDGMKISKSHSLVTSGKKSLKINTKEPTPIHQTSSEKLQDYDNWGITIDSCNGSVHNSLQLSSQTSSPSKRKTESFYEPTLETVDEKTPKSEIMKNQSLVLEAPVDIELEDPAVKRFMEQRELKRQSLKAEALRKAFEEEAKRLQIDQSVLLKEATKLKVNNNNSVDPKRSNISMNIISPINTKAIPNDLSAATNSVLKLISKDVPTNQHHHQQQQQQQQQQNVENQKNIINNNFNDNFKKSFYKSKSFSFCSSRGSYTYKTNSFDESDNDTDYGDILIFDDFEADSNDLNKNKILTPTSSRELKNPSQSDSDINNNDSFENINIIDMLTSKQNDFIKADVSSSQDINKDDKQVNFRLKEKISSKSIFNNFYDPVGFYSMKSPTLSSAGQSSISFNGHSSCNNIYETALNQTTHNFTQETKQPLSPITQVTTIQTSTHNFTQENKQPLSPIIQITTIQTTDDIIKNNNSNKLDSKSDKNVFDEAMLTKLNTNRPTRLSEVSSFNNEAVTDAEESQMTPFSESQVEMAKNVALTSALSILQKALHNPKVRDDAIQSAVKVLENALKISKEYSAFSSKSTSIDQSGDDRANDKKPVKVSSTVTLLQHALKDSSKKRSTKRESDGIFNDEFDDDNIIAEPNYMKNLTTRLPKTSSRDFREYSPEINNSLQKSPSYEIFNKPKTLISNNKLHGKKSANNFIDIENKHIISIESSDSPTISNINSMTPQKFTTSETKQNILKYGGRTDLNNSAESNYQIEKDKNLLMSSLTPSSSVQSNKILKESISVSQQIEINRLASLETQYLYDSNKISISQEKLNFRPNSDRIRNHRYGNNEQSIHFNEINRENNNFSVEKGGFFDNLLSRDLAPTSSSSYKYHRFDNTNKKIPKVEYDNRLYNENQINNHEERISNSNSRSRDKNFMNRNNQNNYLTHTNLVSNQDNFEQSYVPKINASFDFKDYQCPPFQSNICTNISPASSITEDSMDFEPDNRPFRFRESEVIRRNNFSKSKSIERLFYKSNNRKSGGIDDTGFWNCYVCTLQNKPNFLTCEACNAVKKNVI